MPTESLQCARYLARHLACNISFNLQPPRRRVYYHLQFTAEETDKTVTDNKLTRCIQGGIGHGTLVIQVLKAMWLTTKALPLAQHHYSEGGYLASCVCLAEGLVFEARKYMWLYGLAVFRPFLHFPQLVSLSITMNWALRS